MKITKEFNLSNRRLTIDAYDNKDGLLIDEWYSQIQDHMKKLKFVKQEKAE